MKILDERSFKYKDPFETEVRTFRVYYIKGRKTNGCCYSTQEMSEEDVCERLNGWGETINLMIVQGTKKEVFRFVTYREMM